MTDDDTNDRKPIPGSIPSSVRKAGAEARIAEKKASGEWTSESVATYDPTFDD